MVDCDAWVGVGGVGGWEECPLLPRLPLKTYYLPCGAWAERLFQSSPGQDATFWDEMETCWIDCILFRSRFEEKSPRLFPVPPWEWERGRWLPELSWHLERASGPPSRGHSATVCRKRLLSPFQPGLRLGPITLSVISLGIGISKCPQFPVTQTPVAVCFSTYPPGNLRIRVRVRQLLADVRCVSRPCCPINSSSDHCAGKVSLTVCSTVVCFWTSLCAWTQWATHPPVCSSQNQAGTLGPEMLEVQRWVFFLAATSVSTPSAQHHSYICFLDASFQLLTASSEVVLILSYSFPFCLLVLVTRKFVRK